MTIALPILIRDIEIETIEDPDFGNLYRVRSREKYIGNYSFSRQLSKWMALPVEGQFQIACSCPSEAEDALLFADKYFSKV